MPTISTKHSPALHSTTKRTLSLCGLTTGLLLQLQAFGQSGQPAPLQSDTGTINQLLDMQLDESQLRKNMDNTKVVSASKNKENLASAPGLMTVINKQEIEAFGGNSLADVLNRVMGMYVAGSYLFPQNLATIRGDLQTHATSHVLILMDGRPCRESFYGGIDLAIYNTFPLEAIERIEVIRGPGSVLYGTNAFTGVINLITKQEKQTSTKAAVKGGSFGTLGVAGSQAVSAKTFQLQAHGQYFNQKGWNFTATDQNGVSKTIPYGQENTAANVNAVYKNWSFRSFYGYSDRDIFGERPIWREEAYNQLKTSRAFADVGYKHRFTKHWTTTFNTTYNGFLMRSFREDKLAYYVSNDALLETTHFIKPTEQLNLVAGALANYVTGVGNSEQSNEDQSLYYVKAYADLQWSAYAQADYRPVSFLKVIAGGQLNKRPQFKTDFVPRLGTIINFTPEVGAKLLYGEAYKSPGQSERYTLIPNVLYGNPSLSPEKVRTSEAQLFWQKPSYGFTAGYFYSQQRNSIQRVPYLTNATIYQNRGSLTIQGAEVEGKVLPIQQIMITGSFAYQTNVNDEQEKNTTTISNVMVKGGVAYNAPYGFTFGLYNSFFSKPADVINSQQDLAPEKQRQIVNPVPQAFNLLSLNLTANLNRLFHLGKGPLISLNGYGENLLNQQVYNPEFSRRNINSVSARSGKAFYAGLNVKL